MGSTYLGRATTQKERSMKPVISVAWSQWCVMKTESRYFLARQFELREDLLGSDVLSGWVGVMLSDGFECNPAAGFFFLDAVRYVSSYMLQCGVSDGTTPEDMECHWEEVTSLFRQRSMCFSEAE